MNGPYKGVTFTLYFGGQSPQRWSPEHKVQGTLGSCIGELFDYGPQSSGWIQVKLFEKRREQERNGCWGSYWDYAREYDHPLWKALGEEADRHRTKDWSGAYDYLMLYQLVHALRHQQRLPMDVYDAATWSAISALSERSVTRREHSHGGRGASNGRRGLAGQDRVCRGTADLGGALQPGNGNPGDTYLGPSGA